AAAAEGDRVVRLQVADRRRRLAADNLKTCAHDALLYRALQLLMLQGYSMRRGKVQRLFQNRRPSREKTTGRKWPVCGKNRHISFPLSPPRPQRLVVIEVHLGLTERGVIDRFVEASAKRSITTHHSPRQLPQPHRLVQAARQGMPAVAGKGHWPDEV